MLLSFLTVREHSIESILRDGAEDYGRETCCYDRRRCEESIELAKVNATRQAMAKISTYTITEPSTKHPF